MSTTYALTFRDRGAVKQVWLDSDEYQVLNEFLRALGSNAEVATFGQVDQILGTFTFRSRVLARKLNHGVGRIVAAVNKLW